MNISINFPLVTTQDPAVGSVSYNAANHTYDNTATPLRFRTATSTVLVQAPKSFQLHILVDNSGNLISGVSGPDFYCEGEIDVNGDTIIDYSGVLLTGEIAQFGYQDGATSFYDFRFTPTSGSLMPFFAGQDIGLAITSENSTFTGDFSVDFVGKTKGTFGPIDRGVGGAPSVLSGRVFVDANNNGNDDSETGIDGVTVTLTGTDSNNNPVTQTTTTSTIAGIPGSYKFYVTPGNYTITETQPANYLDGLDHLGSLGGTPGNDVFSDIFVGEGVQGVHYDFGELLPGSLSGLVYLDFNNDGLVDFNENVIGGVTVTLYQNVNGNDVFVASTTTDSDGEYFFNNLAPGVYKIVESQPAAYLDGKDTIGTLGGTTANDVFSSITVNFGDTGINYNFGELPTAGGPIGTGASATIGFWHNKNGQALIRSLNGGPTSTQLANWLAATFPNMYGASAGSNNITGFTNDQVASFFMSKFNVTGQKLEAQVLGVAFACYVTNSSLAGITAASYGFNVTSLGTGDLSFNIGKNGAAFGVADNTTLTVMQILLACNAQAVNGVLYNGNITLQNMANVVFDGINTKGDIK